MTTIVSVRTPTVTLMVILPQVRISFNNFDQELSIASLEFTAFFVIVLYNQVNCLTFPLFFYYV